jgi:DNA-binding MarR family transcriptional regulator
MQEAFAIFRRRMMGNLYAYARDKGLTMGQFGAMLHVAHRGGCGVSDIGSDLGITNSAASQMLERLVQLKLIVRSENPADRRSKQIELTNDGRQLLQEGSLANQTWLESLARSMTAEEQEAVGNALAILIARARQLEKSPNWFIRSLIENFLAEIFHFNSFGTIVCWPIRSRNILMKGCSSFFRKWSNHDSINKISKAIYPFDIVSDCPVVRAS